MPADIDPHVRSIRAFNRFYTRKIGVVDGMASNPFSLAEARVLLELARRERPTATEIRKELGLDAGYLSRILLGFERRKLVRRAQSKSDERQKFLSLTEKGRKVFVGLNERSNRDAAAMIEKLPPAARSRLIGALQTVQTVLGDSSETRTPYLLRQHEPGDMGWVVNAKGSSTFGNMDGTRRTRLWPQRSWLNSSGTTIPNENAAGLLRKTACEWEWCSP